MKPSKTVDHSDHIPYRRDFRVSAIRRLAKGEIDRQPGASLGIRNMQHTQKVPLLIGYQRAKRLSRTASN